MRIFPTAHAAQLLGMTPRNFLKFAEEIGIAPLRLKVKRGLQGVSWRYFFTRDQLELIEDSQPGRVRRSRLKEIDDEDRYRRCERLNRKIRLQLRAVRGEVLDEQGEVL